MLYANLYFPFRSDSALDETTMDALDGHLTTYLVPEVALFR
jgi:hypothetical protein